MQPQQDGSPEPPYWTRSQGPAPAAPPEEDRSSAVRALGESSTLSSSATGELESSTSIPLSGRPNEPVIWASSVFGWEDTFEMEDTGYVSSRSTAATFHFLRELCRKNGKETTGREVTEKALKSLRPEIRKALEGDVLNHPRRDRSPRRHDDRRAKGKGKGKQAFAATAAPTKGTGFQGACYNCGEHGHTRAECTKEPKGGGSMRKPGAYCGHCKRRDSHTDNECWEKHPDKRPEKWKQPRAGGPARPAYAAAEVGGEDDPMSPDFDPLTTWGAHLLGQATGVDVMAVGTPEDYPEVRPSTMAQRDTEPAARARTEAERMRAKASKDRLRRGGPPPAFRPQGERPPPDQGAGEAAPPATAEAAEGPGPAQTGPVQRLLPSFGECPVTDPRYQGAEDLERAGVQPHLLAEPTGGGGSSSGDEAEEEGSEEEGEDAEGAAGEATKEDYGVEDMGDAADLTPAERAMRTIPARYRYFPPAQLPTMAEVYLQKHIALMEENFRADPKGNPDREDHRNPGWHKTPRWSNFKPEELEAYILWHGRWLVTYEQHAHRRLHVGETVAAQDAYVLSALGAAQRGLRAYFRDCNESQLTNPDLRMIVNIHEWLMEPPVDRPEDDYAVNLGPPPEEELTRPAKATPHGTRLRVPLSLLQAYFTQRYGTNWVEGFLQNRVVNYPEGMPNRPTPCHDYKLPSTGPLSEGPVTPESVPIKAKVKPATKARPNTPPGLRILVRDAWKDTEPDGSNQPHGRIWREPTPPPTAEDRGGTTPAEGGAGKERGKKRPAGAAAAGGGQPRGSKVPKKVPESTGPEASAAASSAAAKGKAREPTPEEPTEEEETEEEMNERLGEEIAERVRYMYSIHTRNPEFYEGVTTAELVAMYINLSAEEVRTEEGRRMHQTLVYHQMQAEIDLVEGNSEQHPIEEMLQLDNITAAAPLTQETLQQYLALAPEQRLNLRGYNLYSKFLRLRAQELREGFADEIAQHREEEQREEEQRDQRPSTPPATTQTFPVAKRTAIPIPPITAGPSIPVGQKRRAATPPEMEERPRKVAAEDTRDAEGVLTGSRSEAAKVPAADTVSVPAAGGGDQQEKKEEKSAETGAEGPEEPGAEEETGEEGQGSGPSTGQVSGAGGAKPGGKTKTQPGEAGRQHGVPTTSLSEPTSELEQALAAVTMVTMSTSSHSSKLQVAMGTGSFIALPTTSIETFDTSDLTPVPSDTPSTWEHVAADLGETVRALYPNGPEENQLMQAVADEAGYPPLHAVGGQELTRILVEDLRRTYPNNPEVAAVMVDDPGEVTRRTAQRLHDYRKERGLAAAAHTEAQELEAAEEAKKAGKVKAKVGEEVPPTPEKPPGPGAADGVPAAQGAQPEGGVAEELPAAPEKDQGEGAAGGAGRVVPEAVIAAPVSSRPPVPAAPASATPVTLALAMAGRAGLAAPVAKRPPVPTDVVVRVGDVSISWDESIGQAVNRASNAIVRNILPHYLRGPNLTAFVAAHLYEELRRRPPGVPTPPPVPPAKGEEQERQSPGPTDEHPQREQPRRDHPEGDGGGTGGQPAPAPAAAPGAGGHQAQGPKAGTQGGQNAGGAAPGGAGERAAREPAISRAPARPTRLRRCITPE
ncbi:hypothetical protein KFL_005250020 [Klebsormidium nitens]|uniref:CCHC-type domain-containing protein n=1 Tax=Klebsormidium nitens TaxID=105231 RepID=A0A1Y1IJY5_KLENI|nr:hypothetical protein KFL_005250020 [Klebsormidium nitens]|eukprot:GAQ89451.1 hypothetical protein KFL_005250020 [Klebsormidium nitens]